MLAFPLNAPWMRSREMTAFLRRFNALYAVPVHDALLSERGRNLYLTQANSLGGPDTQIRDLGSGGPEVPGLATAHRRPVTGLDHAGEVSLTYAGGVPKLTAKKKCCKDRPRCKKCPVVLMRLEKMGYAERQDSDYKVAKDIPKKVMLVARQR